MEGVNPVIIFIDNSDYSQAYTHGGSKHAS